MTPVVLQLVCVRRVDFTHIVHWRLHWCIVFEKMLSPHNFREALQHVFWNSSQQAQRKLNENFSEQCLWLHERLHSTTWVENLAKPTCTNPHLQSNVCKQTRKKKTLACLLKIVRLGLQTIQILANKNTCDIVRNNRLEKTVCLQIGWKKCTSGFSR